MITITSKRVMFTIENVEADYKLNGSYTLSDNRITDFNGQFYASTQAEGEEAEYLGSYYYNEMGNGKANKNINDVDADIQAALCDLLDTTIAEIKNIKD